MAGPKARLEHAERHRLGQVCRHMVDRSVEAARDLPVRKLWSRQGSLQLSVVGGRRMRDGQAQQLDRGGQGSRILAQSS
jgi:hypothetical protein